jgi:hypothetical protein
MSPALLALTFALPAAAHVVSMSTGHATLRGARLDYEVRMPLYEVAHMEDAERQLFENIHFRGAGGEAKLLDRSCREEAGDLVCTGLFLFERDVDRFDVECTFAAITVPNHVHLLRASNGDRSDQAAFDLSFREAAIGFRPPTGGEIALENATAGFWRALAGLAQLLFLAALVLAGRSPRELVALVSMFAAGQALAVGAGLSSRWPVSPRFLEAASALTIAYLAVELLLLPRAGQRWLVVGVLGTLHGMYFDRLIVAGDYSKLPFLAGVIGAEMVAVAALAATTHLLRALTARRAPWLEKAMASVLLLTGITWFAVRLKS